MVILIQPPPIKPTATPLSPSKWEEPPEFPPSHCHVKYLNKGGTPKDLEDSHDRGLEVKGEITRELNFLTDHANQ